MKESLDDKIDAIKQVGNDILKATNGMTKKEKWKPEEKSLCKEQTELIDNHVKECQICKKSLESYHNSYGVAQTPPCSKFLEQLQTHINNCDICSDANKKWNDDAIPVTKSMRKVAGELGRMFHK